MDYRAYNLRNYTKIKQISKVSKEHIKSIEVVGTVLPFKTNNYVVDELIDWDNYANDPMFKLNFPQKDMLKSYDFEKMEHVLYNSSDRDIIAKTAFNIRESLNPHPAGQFDYNVPSIDGQRIAGVQHKYDQTMLFFPSQGQTCHAYCTFCFRWPQFTNTSQQKFSSNNTALLIKYLKQNPQITDLLITGGDPMVMKASMLDNYITQILEANIPSLMNIRIGSKSLAFWPYRFTSDSDADDMLRLFEKIVKSGINLSFMAHFNHPNELRTKEVQKAIKRIQSTGVIIRSQSPILNHINADANIWSDMWNTQVKLGIIPYYMFIARDTGAQQYFGVSLVKAWDIFSKAYSESSGLARTVRGPSMSCTPGKIRVLGSVEVNNEKLLCLDFIQARDKNWVGKPFFAKYNDLAQWITDLEPAFGSNNFFYEQESKLVLN